VEDDLREETGDKEDSGNDRTLALPRTTTETSEEKSYQKSALTAYFFQRQEKQQKKLESQRQKSRQSFSSGVAR